MGKKTIAITICLMLIMTFVPFGVMAEDVQQSLPIYDEMESVSIYLEPGSGSVSLTQDRMVGDYAVKVEAADVSGKDYINYTLAESAEFDVSEYSRIKLWVKPGAGAKWIKFFTGNNVLIQNDKNRDGIFRIGEDLVSGQWNEVVLDLTKTIPSITKASNLVVQTNDLSTWLYDEITSFYSPALTIDTSYLVNGQTQEFNGELQFKPNTAVPNSYNISPTVLIANDSSTAAGFSRDSVAYKDDGTQIGIDVPRYEKGYFHNLLTDNQADIESSLPNGYVGVETISRAVDTAFNGDSSIKIVSGSGASDGIDFWNDSPGVGFPVIPGKTYTFSAYMKGSVGGEKVSLSFYKPDWSGGLGTSAIATLTTTEPFAL